jgi:hypothetical protein
MKRIFLILFLLLFATVALARGGGGGGHAGGGHGGEAIAHESASVHDEEEIGTGGRMVYSGGHPVSASDASGTEAVSPDDRATRLWKTFTIVMILLSGATMIAVVFDLEI